MKRQVVIYAGALALGAFALDWIEYRYLTQAYSTELFVLIIATAFLVLGVWIGGMLTPKTIPSEFEINAAALCTLKITKREYAVLELLADGQSNKEMARQLGVSPNTIKSHLTRLFDKLEVQRRTQAIARARALSLIM